MKIGIVKMAAGKHREPNVERQFLPQGSELFIVDFTGDRRKLVEDLRGLDALLVSYVPIDAEILDALDICQAIAVPAVGWNWIDAPAAWKKGIAVMANGPYCTQEVADHTLALLLALNRRLMDYHRGVQADGLWKWDAFPDIRRLEGQTLGILGFGAIGRAVARRAQAFGIRVVAHDPFVPESLAREMDVELLDAPELLARADVVSNHMNLNETSRGFFNRETFALMRRKPLLINVGRGRNRDRSRSCPSAGRGRGVRGRAGRFGAGGTGTGGTPPARTAQRHPDPTHGFLFRHGAVRLSADSLPKSYILSEWRT